MDDITDHINAWLLYCGLLDKTIKISAASNISAKSRKHKDYKNIPNGLM